jgi:hypothetical protein
MADKGEYQIPMPTPVKTGGDSPISPVDPRGWQGSSKASESKKGSKGD